MAEIYKLHPDKEVNYHFDDKVITGVSIDSGFNRFYLGITEDFCSKGGEVCPVNQEEIKQLCIAWLAIVDPDVLKADEE